MNNFELRPRLKMVADLVCEGRPLADIGTDHAYLPSYLILKGKIPCAVAADLRSGPLKNAQATISEYALGDRIKTILSDGLDELSPNDAKEIVIAGMGGTLIAEILERIAWIRKDDIHLVLQPQTHSEDVRRFLLTNGFKIICEDATIEDGRHYIAISAVYTGEKVLFTQGYLFYGELPKCEKKEAYEYLNMQINFLQNKMNALKSNNKEPETVKMLSSILDELKEKVKCNDYGS